MLKRICLIKKGLKEHVLTKFTVLLRVVTL